MPLIHAMDRERSVIVYRWCHDIVRFTCEKELHVRDPAWQPACLSFTNGCTNMLLDQREREEDLLAPFGAQGHYIPLIETPHQS
jgi:hypothetical protein